MRLLFVVFRRLFVFVAERPYLTQQAEQVYIQHVVSVSSGTAFHVPVLCWLAWLMNFRWMPWSSAQPANAIDTNSGYYHRAFSPVNPFAQQCDPAPG